jgi:cytosine/adenosine deaminase-related metal-dependent hydrolase
MDDRVPTMAQVFRMATSGGAQTTPYATEIGTLEVGKTADMVLIDWKGSRSATPISIAKRQCSTR